MTSTTEDVPKISPQELWQAIHNGRTPPLIIDVREPREFKRGHIPEAKLEPLPTLLTTMNGHSTDHQIVVVCRSGWRSHRAVQILRAKGYAHTMMLEGGMLAWEKAGLAEKVSA